MCARFAAVLVDADFVAPLAGAFFAALFFAGAFFAADFFVADFFAVAIAPLEADHHARGHSRHKRNFNAVANG